MFRRVWLKKAARHPAAGEPVPLFKESLSKSLGEKGFSGRIITSFSPLVAGLLARAFGGNFNLACAVMTFFATLSLLAVLIGPETRHQQLAE